jgi:hypothetical protein
LLAVYLTGFALVLATYFFVIFSVTRGLLKGIGFDASTSFQCSAVTLLMAGFIIWLAPMGHFLEAWFLHRLPTLRARRGLCPSCGHAAPPIGDRAPDDSARCSECGGDYTMRPPLQLGWPSLRRFLIVAGAAYLLGSGAAAIAIRADEAAFLREVAAGQDRPHARPRAWPANFATLSFDGESASSSSVVEPTLDPAWRARDRN